MLSAKYYLLISLCAQTIIAFQPDFLNPVLNISVASGRDATFTCHVRHLGGYRVGWVKADTKAIQAIHEQVITHNARVSVSHSDATTWNLHIKAVTEEDSGGYMCQLNTDPMKSQVGYLEVLVPPDFTTDTSSADVITPEGYSVQLVCTARGNPQPIVTWRREDGQEIVVKDALGNRQLASSYRGETLKLQGSRTEMGSYLCISSNGVPPSISKRISLTVQFHPEIVVTNQLVGSPFGTDVTIECNVQASPKPINYWIRDNGEILSPSFKQILQEIAISTYETKMSVTIRNFQTEDIGSYRCISKNSLGEVESSIRLYEIPGQTTRKTTTQRMPELQNHIDTKPPFSASNYYKKVTSTTEEETTLRKKIKSNARPTKATIEHILKQQHQAPAGAGGGGGGGGLVTGDSSGSRQTHLIVRSGGSGESVDGEEKEQQQMRDMFGNAGPSLAPGVLLPLLLLALLRIIYWRVGCSGSAAQLLSWPEM